MAPLPTKPLQPSRRRESFDPRAALAFGVVARSNRVALGIAQDRLALLADVDRSYYGKLERGQRQPSLALILRVSAALQMSAADLVRQVEAQLLDEASTPPQN